MLHVGSSNIRNVVEDVRVAVKERELDETQTDRLVEFGQ